MQKANPKVDWYFTKEKKWQKEFEQLRKIILSCRMTEQMKWGHPCYMLDESNIVLIHGFKDYCALLFFKGALMKDPNGILIQQTKNVQGPRQIRFNNVSQIIKLKSILKSYIKEAILVEKSGLKVQLKKTSEYNVPEEFQIRLDEIPELKTAFEALTHGRQRGYLLFFSAPKQSKTRIARIEKSMSNIYDGKGLND